MENLIASLKQIGEKRPLSPDGRDTDLTMQIGNEEGKSLTIKIHKHLVTQSSHPMRAICSDEWLRGEKGKKEAHFEVEAKVGELLILLIYSAFDAQSIPNNDLTPAEIVSLAKAINLFSLENALREFVERIDVQLENQLRRCPMVVEFQFVKMYCPSLQKSVLSLEGFFLSHFCDYLRKKGGFRGISPCEVKYLLDLFDEENAGKLKRLLLSKATLATFLMSWGQICEPEEEMRLRINEVVKHCVWHVDKRALTSIYRLRETYSAEEIEEMRLSPISNSLGPREYLYSKPVTCPILLALTHLEYIALELQFDLFQPVTFRPNVLTTLEKVILTECPEGEGTTATVQSVRSTRKIVENSQVVFDLPMEDGFYVFSLHWAEAAPPLQRHCRAVFYLRALEMDTLHRTIAPPFYDYDL